MTSHEVCVTKLAYFVALLSRYTGTPRPGK